MVDQNVANLGSALTALGLEDKFLSSGELSNFSLVERGRIANGIIAEKLRLGRWEAVVRMIYGEFGKIDVLYDGDRNELRERIVKSATEHSKSAQLGEETLEALFEAGENDLIFRLATNVSTLNYKDFNAAVRYVSSDYFSDAEQGDQRKIKLHQIAASKAMKEREYDSAFNHLSEIGDIEGIGQVFEATLEDRDRWHSGELLEKILLSDDSRKDERLKRIVLSSISEKSGLDPLVAFELYKKYGNDLSSQEAKTLQVKLVESLAESASGYDINRIFIDNPEVRLLWAEKHAKDEPRVAYSIFRQQEFDGTSVIVAVQEGLSLGSYQNEERALSTSEVAEAHLRRAYETASFDIRVKIASHLKDSGELQRLSKQAQENGALSLAYRLWVTGGGSLEGKYIDRIRTSLIADGINNRFGSMNFLEKSDARGFAEAYDTLMQTDKGVRTDNLRLAYEIALDLRDEERVQRAREEIVATNIEWAIHKFTSGIRGNDDKGLDYVLGIVASQHRVEQRELKRLVEKYQTA